MKKRITVYIDEMVWREVQRSTLEQSAERLAFGREKISSSQYVEAAIKFRLALDIEMKDVIKSNPDIEAQKKNKVYKTTEKPRVNLSAADRIRAKMNHVQAENDEIVNARSDLSDSELEAANERLKKKREGAKKSRPKKKASNDVYGALGYSKTRQLGKTK